MKNWKIFLLVLPIIGFCKTFNLEVRAGYYQFLSSQMQDLYGQGGLVVGIQGDVLATKNFMMWANVDNLSKSGHSIGFGDPTYVNITSGSFGPSFRFGPVDKAYGYVGVGPIGAFVHTEDHSPYLASSTNSFSLGVVGKLGVRFLYKSFVFDGFMDYSYQPLYQSYAMAINDSTINIGGVKVGLGIGYEF